MQLVFSSGTFCKILCFSELRNVAEALVTPPHLPHIPAKSSGRIFRVPGLSTPLHVTAWFRVECALVSKRQ